MDMPGFFQYKDALVYKLDDNGNQIWVDTAYAGTFAQQSYNLKVTDSVIYVGGRTCRAIGIDSCDALFFTTDANTGVTGWDFTLDNGFGYEEIDGIAIESDGIYLTGWTEGNGSEIDALLVKIDYSGSIIWQTTWGVSGARDDHQDGHIVVDDSMIYISGLYNGSPSLGWDGKALLAKFDKTTGNFVDSVTYGRDDVWFNAENALGMTSDGTDLFITGYTTTSGNNWDILLAKYDKNFNQIFYTTWGGGSTESARAISLDNNGNIYIGGLTESYGAGESDVVLLKYNPLGNLEWYKTWGDTLHDQTLDIYIHNENLYLTGKTKSFHPTEKEEALLLKIKIDSTTSILQQEVLQDNYTIYPNPITNKAILKFSNINSDVYTLSIFNISGKKVQTKNNINSQEVIIEKNNLSSGLFYFKLFNNNHTKLVGKFIVE
jgi:hypothetical protein